jgi:hypothetical protein
MMLTKIRTKSFLIDLKRGKNNNGYNMLPPFQFHYSKSRKNTFRFKECGKFIEENNISEYLS